MVNLVVLSVNVGVMRLFISLPFPLTLELWGCSLSVYLRVILRSIWVKVKPGATPIVTCLIAQCSLRNASQCTTSALPHSVMRCSGSQCNATRHHMISQRTAMPRNTPQCSLRTTNKTICNALAANKRKLTHEPAPHTPPHHTTPRHATARHIKREGHPQRKKQKTPKPDGPPSGLNQPYRRSMKNRPDLIRTTTCHRHCKTT